MKGEIDTARKIQCQGKGGHCRDGAIFGGGADQSMVTALRGRTAGSVQTRGYHQQPPNSQRNIPNLRRRRRRKRRRKGASGRSSAP